jgi:hypothetical protein
MRISPFSSRLLALGLLLACLFALFKLVAEPLMAEYNANRAAIAQAYRLETRYRTIAAGRPALARRLRRMENGLKISELSFPDASDALTGAKIQSTLKELVSESGGRLNSTQILETVEESGFRRIAIRVQMVSDIAALQAIMYRLETMTPYLYIDNVVLRGNAASRRRQARRRSRRQGVAQKTQSDGQLNIRFDVLGYSKPGGA